MLLQNIKISFKTVFKAYSAHIVLSYRIFPNPHLPPPRSNNTSFALFLTLCNSLVVK